VRWGDGLTGCWACTLSVLVVIGSGAWIWCSTTEGILKLASLALTSKLDLGVSALHFGLGVWILYVECVVWMVRCSGKMVPCFRSGFEVEGEWDSGVVLLSCGRAAAHRFLIAEGATAFLRASDLRVSAYHTSFMHAGVPYSSDWPINGPDLSS
jgi:hypothetical protein